MGLCVFYVSLVSRTARITYHVLHVSPVSGDKLKNETAGAQVVVKTARNASVLLKHCMFVEVFGKMLHSAGEGY